MNNNSKILLKMKATDQKKNKQKQKNNKATVPHSSYNLQLGLH